MTTDTTQSGTLTPLPASGSAALRAANALGAFAAFLREHPDLPLYAVQVWTHEPPTLDVTPCTPSVPDDLKRTMLQAWATALGSVVTEDESVHVYSGWRGRDDYWRGVRTAANVGAFRVELCVQVDQREVSA